LADAILSCMESAMIQPTWASQRKVFHYGRRLWIKGAIRLLQPGAKLRVVNDSLSAVGNHLFHGTCYEIYKFIRPNSTNTTQLRTAYEGEEDSSLLGVALCRWLSSSRRFERSQFLRVEGKEDQ